MSYAEQHVVDVTTSTGGSATAYTPAVKGRVANIIYEKSTSNPFTTGVDFAITAEVTGLGIWSENNVDASKTVSPTQPVHNQSGVLRSQSTASANDVPGPIWVSGERVKIAITNGGASNEGKFRVVIA